MALNEPLMRSRGLKIKKSKPQARDMDEAEQSEASITPGPSKQSLRKKVKRLEREQRRLRNTVSFQLGIHLTTAVKRPWRLLALPISFPLLALKLGYNA